MLAVHLDLNSLYLCPLMLVLVLSAKKSIKIVAYASVCVCVCASWRWNAVLGTLSTVSKHWTGVREGETLIGPDMFLIHTHVYDGSVQNNGDNVTFIKP